MASRGRAALLATPGTLRALSTEGQWVDVSMLAVVAPVDATPDTLLGGAWGPIATATIARLPRARTGRVRFAIETDAHGVWALEDDPRGRRSPLPRRP